MSPNLIALQRGTPLTKNQMLQYRLSDAEIALAPNAETGMIQVSHLTFNLLDKQGIRVGQYRLSANTPLQIQGNQFECAWANTGVTVREAAGTLGQTTSSSTARRGRRSKAKAVGSSRTGEGIS